MEFTATATFQFDMSQGQCGESHPDDPEIKCGFPVVQGEAFHLLSNAHLSVKPDGTHVWWPVTKKPSCSCHCHSCCVPMDACCDQCPENHPGAEPDE